MIRSPLEGTVADTVYFTDAESYADFVRVDLTRVFDLAGLLDFNSIYIECLITR